MSGKAAMGGNMARRDSRSCKAGVPRRMGSKAEGHQKGLGIATALDDFIA